MASKWMVFLKEDLYLSDVEAGIVIETMGLFGLSRDSDRELDYFWGERLGRLRWFVWKEKGFFTRRGIVDRWTSRLTAVVNMLLFADWIDDFEGGEILKYSVCGLGS